MNNTERTSPQDRCYRLLSRMSAFVFECAPDGRLLSIGDTILALTGYAPAELEGQAWCDRLFPGSQRAQLHALDRRLRFGDVFNHELTATGRDGQPVVLEVTTAND